MVFSFSHRRLNLNELSVTAKRVKREKTNPTENYYYSLDLKRIATIDPGKSHDFLLCYILVQNS